MSRKRVTKRMVRRLAGQKRIQQREIQFIKLAWRARVSAGEISLITQGGRQYWDMRGKVPTWDRRTREWKPGRADSDSGPV